MRSAGLLLLGIAATMGFGVSHARAIPPFKDAFEQKYVDKSDAPAFKSAFDDAKCNVCHVAHKAKSLRNEYGKALAKFTGGNVAKRLAAAQAQGGAAAEKAELKKILKTLDSAFDKVADQKSPNSPTGQTFGDLIKAGKLPNSK